MLYFTFWISCPERLSPIVLLHVVNTAILKYSTCGHALTNTYTYVNNVHHEFKCEIYLVKDDDSRLRTFWWNCHNYH